MRSLSPFLLVLFLIFFSLEAFALDRVYIETFDKIKIEGFFHYPENIDEAKSLIIVIGGSSYTKGGFGGPARFAKAFAEQGHIGFEWNKRGLRTNDELNVVTCNREEYEGANLDNLVLDAEVALIFAHNRYPHLPVYVVGGSEGSIVTTLLAEKYPKIISAAATFGTVVNSFIDYVLYQMNDNISEEFFKFDQDDNQVISEAEFNRACSESKAFADLIEEIGIDFETIDFFKDGVIERNEIKRMLANYSLFKPGYMLQTSGMPDSYFASIYSITPLYNRIQNITIPVGFFHGSDDWATPVDKMLQLEIVAKTLKLDNFSFRYYTGVGHAPSDEMAIDILKFFESN